MGLKDVGIAVGVRVVCSGVGAGDVGAAVVGTRVSCPDANVDSSKSSSGTHVVIRQRESFLLDEAAENAIFPEK